jgi:hypothetical protein
MKKVLIVLIALLLLSSLAWSQESPKPRFAAQLVIGGFILAPIGVGGELFLGPVGLEAEVRGLFFGTADGTFGTVEPAVNAQFYFSSLDSTLYLTAGISYATVWASGEGVASSGLLQPKAALGYHALFGKNDRTRFGVELGAVWWKSIVEGRSLEEVIGIPDTIWPYFKLYFGRVFY